MTLFWILALAAILLVTLAVGWPLRQYKLLCGIIITILPLFTCMLYFRYGYSTQLATYYNNIIRQQLVKQELTKFHNSGEVIAKLQQILQQHPASAQGWYLLGRLYFAAANYHQATAAFATALHLDATKFVYVVQYLQSSYVAHNGQFDLQAHNLLNHIAKKYPNSQDVLNFMALDAYARHDYAAAIGYWERLLPQVAADTVAQQHLLAAIAKAQHALNTSDN